MNFLFSPFIDEHYLQAFCQLSLKFNWAWHESTVTAGAILSRLGYHLLLTVNQIRSQRAMLDQWLSLVLYWLIWISWCILLAKENELLTVFLFTLYNKCSQYEARGSNCVPLLQLRPCFFR